MAEEQQPEEAAPASGGSGMLGKLMIAGFMGFVILTECLLAYFWIPSADDIAARAQAKIADDMAQRNEDDLGVESAETAGLVEVDFGEFNITAAQPSTNSSLRIDFIVAGTVAKENKDKVEELFEAKKYRFATNVEFVIRNAEISELNDPGLGLIQRQILTKSNRLFGETLVKEILITGFSLVDQ